MYNNDLPRYLPHLHQADILQMGLSPLDTSRWIETDNHWRRYHEHKLASRRLLGKRVYRALPSSAAAQIELAEMLQHHLLQDQASLYRMNCSPDTLPGSLHFVPESMDLPSAAGETLWHCSLWIADDLVILEKYKDEYHLTAASLCSPSDWLLEEKFNRPLTEIHQPIPGFTRTLTPSINRFFDHLKATRPVERWNWSLQVGEALCNRAAGDINVSADTPIYYRSERQTLRRLTRTGAVAFTIRVYLHPLQTLADEISSLAILLKAIDNTPEALADYKGFGELAPALDNYRKLVRDADMPAG